MTYPGLRRDLGSHPFDLKVLGPSLPRANQRVASSLSDNGHFVVGTECAYTGQIGFGRLYVGI